MLVGVVCHPWGDGEKSGVGGGGGGRSRGRGKLGGLGEGE